MKAARSPTRPPLALLERMSNVCNCSRKVLFPVPSNLQKNTKGTYNGVASLIGSAIAHPAMDSQEVKVENEQKDYEAFTAESSERDRRGQRGRGVAEHQDFGHHEFGSSVLRRIGFDHITAMKGYRGKGIHSMNHSTLSRRMDAEMKVVGECGVKNKVWYLLTRNEKDDGRTFEGQLFRAAKAAKHYSGRRRCLSVSRLTYVTCCCGHKQTCTRHPFNATRWLKPCHKSVSSCFRDLHGERCCYTAGISRSSSAPRTALSAEQVAALTQQI